MSYPEFFTGFGVESSENWTNPKKVSFKPKAMKPTDIDIEILCCGVCGTDCHTAAGHWGPIKRTDLVVGHEIVGVVKAIGAKVNSESSTSSSHQYKIGDLVGVGAQSRSCLDCSRCHSGNESYCPKIKGTYNSILEDEDDYVTQGGYASHVRVNAHFAFPIPEGIKPEHAAPLMCGGLTVYSPLLRNGAGPGKTVGIIGIGGLGHMAIMIAKAMGAHVVAFSRGSSKRAQALEMGADDFIATGESSTWSADYFDKFDFILNCASSTTELDLNAFITVLKVQGRFVSVGLPPVSETFAVSPFTFAQNASSLGTSLLGSRQEVADLLELCSKHDIKPWVEEIPISEEGVHQALSRCDKGDVRYRFVLTNFKQEFAN